MCMELEFLVTPYQKEGIHHRIWTICGPLLFCSQVETPQNISCIPWITVERHLPDQGGQSERYENLNGTQVLRLLHQKKLRSGGHTGLPKILWASLDCLLAELSDSGTTPRHFILDVWGCDDSGTVLAELRHPILDVLDLDGCLASKPPGRAPSKESHSSSMYWFLLLKKLSKAGLSAL